MKRRDFIRSTACGAGGLLLGIPKIQASELEENADLVMVRHGSPSEMVRKSLELLGGMSKFVKSGHTVLVKPNMGWDRAPEYGANTHPEVAAEIVKLCIESGAGKVLAFDRTCNNPKRCYINSGLEKAMTDAGAKVRFMHDQRYDTVKIPEGYLLTEWDFYRDALQADVIINVPVLKHHSLSQLTMGMKNIMGLAGGNRGSLHKSFNKKIVDLNRVIRPQLTVLDAVRVLRSNGPSGGNLDDVQQMNTIIAGIDPVLVDAWGAKLYGIEPMQLAWLRNAQAAGLGTCDITNNIPQEYSFA